MKRLFSSTGFQKWFSRIADTAFIVSLTLLTKFENTDELLKEYQLIVAIFLTCGTLKYANQINIAKESLLDFLKDILIAVVIVPIWYWISGSLDIDFAEAISNCTHYLMFFILFLCTCYQAKLSGPIAYYTTAAVPVVSLILIRLGCPLLIAVSVAEIANVAVNYPFYKRRRAQRLEKEEAQ